MSQRNNSFLKIHTTCLLSALFITLSLCHAQNFIDFVIQYPFSRKIIEDNIEYSYLRTNCIKAADKRNFPENLDKQREVEKCFIDNLKKLTHQEKDEIIKLLKEAPQIKKNELVEEKNIFTFSSPSEVLKIESQKLEEELTGENKNIHKIQKGWDKKIKNLKEDIKSEYASIIKKETITDLQSKKKKEDLENLKILIQEFKYLDAGLIYLDFINQYYQSKYLDF